MKKLGLKRLIDNLPTEPSKLFAYEVDWKVFDEVNEVVLLKTRSNHTLNDTLLLLLFITYYYYFKTLAQSCREKDAPVGGKKNSRIFGRRGVNFNRICG